jgi:hypothetical protein
VPADRRMARYKYLWELEAGRASKAEGESFGRLYDRIVVEREACRQAVRECVEALRERNPYRRDVLRSQPNFYAAQEAVWDSAADFLERTMLGGEDD